MHRVYQTDNTEGGDGAQASGHGLSSGPGDLSTGAPGTLPWANYALGAALPLVALALREVVPVSVQDHALLMLFVLPIIFSAMVGGLGTGLIATAMTAFTTDFFLLVPLHSLAIGEGHDLAQWGILITSGVLVSVMSESLHRGRRLENSRWRELANAQHALQLSGRRYRDTLDNLLEGCQIIGRDWRYLYVNDAVCRQAQKLKSGLLGNTMMEKFPGIEHTPLFDALRRCMDQRLPQLLENEFMAADGARRWFELSVQPVPEGIFILSAEITARKARETEITRLNRLYATLGEINQSIVRCADRQELFADLCRVVVQYGHFPAASISWRAPGTQPTIVVHRTGPEGNASTLPSWKKGTCNLVNEALQSGKLAYCHDVQQDPRASCCRDVPGLPKLQSCAAFPLTMHGEVCGALSICSTDPGFFREEEAGLLENVAADISLALDRMEHLENRRRAEFALRESERRYRDLVQNTNSVILRWARDGKILFLNDFGQNVFGYTLEEAIGQSVSVLVPQRESEGRDLSQLITAITTEPERFVSHINENVCRDGRRIWMAWTNRAIRDDRGEILEMLAVGSDVTPLKQAQEQLRRTSERLKLATEAGQIGIWDLDLTQDRLVWDEAMHRLYGISPEEFRGNQAAWKNCLHPDDQHRALAEVQAAVNGERDFRSEFRIIWPDGTIRYIQANGQIQRDDQGQPVRLVGTNWDTTERKLAERALEEEAVRRRILIEQSSDGIVVLNQEGGIYEANRRYAEMLGYTVEEVLKLHLWDWDAQWSREELLRMALEVDERGAKFETVHRRKNGTLFNVEISSNGAMVGGRKLVFCVCRDITDRKLAEEGLRQRLELQNRFSKIAEAVPGTIYTWRLAPDGTMSMPFASSALVQDLGVVPEDVQSDASPIFSRVHPEDIDRLRESIMASARDISLWRAEFRFRGVDGAEYWIEGHSMPERQADGSVMWYGYLHDVTERKRAEERVRQLSRAVEQSPATVVITDVTGAIEYVNPKFVEVTGYTFEEARGQNPRILKSNEVSPKVYCELWETIRAGREWRGELRNRRKNGDLFWELALISPIVDEKGRITHYLGIKEDITERKRLEQERGSMEARLRQQQRLESIGTLAGGVAHEINNPINGIMNYAQLIQDRLAPESSLREFTADILHETQRVATIVRNLLTFSRNEKVTHSPARLIDIAESTLSLIRTIIRHDQILLETDVPEDLPQLNCRSQQIQQVIMNLMINARDALNERFPGPSPDKRLNLRARPIEREGRGWLRIIVEDLGTGISPEVRERMFDPFFTTKPRDRGTGLGLAITHGIVKEHGGLITVESELNRFTRIEVDLPL